jgi:hypothetical protein
VLKTAGVFADRDHSGCQRPAKVGYFVFALAIERLLRIDGMLSRTESIDGFHLKLSRTEKEMYEEFLKTEETEILAEMQQYFAEAKQKAGGIRFDDQSLWSRIKSTVDAWIANACADKHVNRELVRRAKEAILHRVRKSDGQDHQGIVGRAMRLPEAPAAAA